MRITEKRNLRVEVRPDAGNYITRDVLALTERMCLDIVREVRRHLDDVESVAFCFDRVAVCSFCEYVFHSTESANDLPACCDAAIDEFLIAEPLYVGRGAHDREWIAEARARLASENPSN